MIVDKKNMTPEKIADICGWHIVSEDGYPLETCKNGFWCKDKNGMYNHCFYDNETGEFYRLLALLGKVYYNKDFIIAWQYLTEIVT